MNKLKELELRIELEGVAAKLADAELDVELTAQLAKSSIADNPIARADFIRAQLRLKITAAYAELKGIITSRLPEKA